MQRLYDTAPPAIRAFLVGLWDEKIERREAESLTAELAGLVRSLGHETAGVEIVRLREDAPRSSAFGIGSGKVDEIAEKCAGADCLILDWDLSPSQQRNWENRTGISVFDRRELIIQIFGSRARTREAGLQVELARLKFSLPRLTHKYLDLARQRGGSYGAKGSGETKFETGRRVVENRIHHLEQELKKVRKQRSVQRGRRERRGESVCALAGYTNAGKSSLLNALTGASVEAADKLFATLDTTARRLVLTENSAPYVDGADGGVNRGAACAADGWTARTLIITDTVGFIRRLPHDLVDAFRSTLEELSFASVIVNVLDASSPDAEEHYRTTMSVLKSLGEEEKPFITALNKIDAGAPPGALEKLTALCLNPVPVSARTGEGLFLLLEKITEQIKI